MPLPHMLFKLVGTAVAFPFIVAAAYDLTVVPNPMVYVENVTLKVRRASECLHTTVVGDIELLNCYFEFSSNLYSTNYFVSTLNNSTINRQSIIS